jgi:ATP-dependent helicase IRC3
MMEERDYQTRAEDAVVSEYDKGVRRMLNVQATGTGKTVVFSRLIKKMLSRLPGQTLVLAHTEELVDQNKVTLSEVNPELSVSKEMAGEYADPKADIIVASVATLGRKDTKRVERFDWNNVDKIIIDEAHHSTGDGYRRVLDIAGALAPNSRKLLLGTTATPNRPDGTGLSEIYEKVANVYSVRDAVKDGWLVEPRGWVMHTSTSLAGISTTAGDYTKSELSKAVDTQARNHEVVEFWRQYAQGRQTVVFCVDIQHAQDMAEEFKKAGVAAESVWGDDPDRAKKIQAHKNGEIQILCNCAVLTEGYDDWQISCVVLACPTLSSIKFAQMIGRGLRLDPSTGNLRQWRKVQNTGVGARPHHCVKVDCVVLDVVDSSARNSLLTLPTLMGLPAGLDLKGQSLLEAVERIETAQEEFPSLDFTKLTDLSSLAKIIEQVDLFQVRFPEEVEANSELTWFRATDGGYKMRIPKETGKPGFIRIFENLLSKWEIIAEINDEGLHGTRHSLEEAFKAADEQIRKRVSPQTLSCIKREATWHNKPVTTGQKRMLERLFPKRVFVYDTMTSGQASRAISERLIRTGGK